MDILSFVLDIERGFIVAVGLLVVLYSLKQFCVTKDYRRLLYAFIGLYWALYYIWAMVRDTLEMSLATHREFVRFGVLFTLTIVLGDMIGRWRNRHHA